MSMETIPGEAYDQERGVRTTLQVCYILYGLSYVLGGVPAIIAIIIDYIKKDDAENYPTLRQHFTWQINTFWGLLALGVVGCLLLLVGIGFIILFAGWCWGMYRAIKGWIYLSGGRSLYGDSVASQSAQHCSPSTQGRPAYRPGATPAGPRFCVNCGSQLEPDSAFCSNCGKKI